MASDNIIFTEYIDSIHATAVIYPQGARNKHPMSPIRVRYGMIILSLKYNLLMILRQYMQTLL